MTYTRQQIAAVCQKLAPSLGPMPPGIDGAQLTWAISGNESSFGAQCQPRHEAAYDVGGVYANHLPMPTLLHLYGSAAAMSYSAWQVMLCDAPAGYSPTTFLDINMSARACVYVLNGILRRFRPTTLAQIGECYNAGRETPDAAYTDKLAVSYATPMPN